jgi:hypothetical protein
MTRTARIIVIVAASVVGLLFVLRGLGFHDGASTREVTVHVVGLGGMTDLALGPASGAADLTTLEAAGGMACKPRGGVLRTLLAVRGPKAVFLTEIVPSGQTFRLRWDCRLHALRMADQ